MVRHIIAIFMLIRPPCRGVLIFYTGGEGKCYKEDEENLQLKCFWKKCMCKEWKFNPFGVPSILTRTSADYWHVKCWNLFVKLKMMHSTITLWCHSCSDEIISFFSLSFSLNHYALNQNVVTFHCYVVAWLYKPCSHNIFCK